ncbi:uncharacterized protein LOC143702636 isoform X2 [Siphateles boraxobius]|uniref:uncharacterized protein LOC143702636 isoform X2 n=1 Tax=Siphateles boraxobius TaxID=180520 RepID=UPI0040632EA4
MAMQIQSPDAEGVNAVQKSKARHYFQTCRDPAFFMFCNFMHDSLTHLSSLSLTLQTSAITVAEVHSCLTATQTVLTKYKTQPGPKLKACMKQHENDDSALNHVMKAKCELLDKLCQSLQSRFTDMTIGILQATKLVNLNSWPDADRSKEFGESEVEELTTHFQSILTSSGSLLSSSQISGPFSRPDCMRWERVST